MTVNTTDMCECTYFTEGEPSGYTCEVLKCAEAEGGLSLKNDTRYDYYSIYGKPLREYLNHVLTFYIITSYGLWGKRKKNNHESIMLPYVIFHVNS